MIIRKRIGGKTLLKVVRPERLKTLRAHLFGLTLGLTAVLAHLIFAASSLKTLGNLLLWLVVGYLAGAIFCLSYNALAYFYPKFIHPEWFKLWFWYDESQVVNIIKTPIPQQDWDETIRARYNEVKFKVFDYRGYDNVEQNGKKMTHPYTVVFVANPYLRLRQKEGGAVMAEVDPIMHNVHLFLKAVYRALFSFEFNEVIGRPDIFSKIRIVTVNEAPALFGETPVVGRVEFESVKNHSYVRQFLGGFEVDADRDSAGPDEGADTFAERMLAPNLNMRQRVLELVRQRYNHIQHIDVIFAVSASPTHDMSSAWPASNDWRINSADAGRYFTFSTDPYCYKGDEILKNDCEKRLCEGEGPKVDEVGDCITSEPSHFQSSRDRVMIHEYFPNPDGIGMVAMSAFDVRAKLPVHEFAHAMSSTGHGMIVDEYYDFATITNATTGAETDSIGGTTPFEPPHPGLIVNRIFRNPARMENSHSVPVHKHFARYNGHVYESDRNHHIAQQGWYSYHPGRKNPEVRCTMEATEDVFQFDELLTDFIYDRLWVKVNRDYLR